MFRGCSVRRQQTKREERQIKAIPSYRAAHLGPYLDFLYGIGAPVERGLRHAGLPTMLADRPDAFLPQLPTLAFLEAMRSREGIDDLALRALLGIQLDDLSESTMAAIIGSPMLSVALGHFSKLAPLEDTYIKSWFSIDGDTVKLHMTNLYPLDPQTLRYEDWSELLVLITIVRAFAGPDWTPETIGFRSDGPISQFVAVIFPNTRFLTTQKSAFISLSHRLLSLPPRARADGTGKALVTCPDTLLSAATSWEFASSLRQVLTAYIGNGMPPVQLAAELAGTSVRTLQRRLQQCNLSCTDLVKQARFELASTLLRNSDRKIIDIAYELGYADPAHFTRAFRGLAGISPLVYRNQHRLN